MKKKINEIIYTVSRYMEIIFSIIILAIIAVSAVPLLHEFFATPLLMINRESFSTFLADSLALVVGIEFVKMLCKHTAETLLEVLMFATARQMVVEHLETWQTLIGVLAIAVLFATRKYFLLRQADAEVVKDKL